MRWLQKLHFDLALQNSQPILWILTAAPFAAAYLVTDSEITLDFWVSLFYFTLPYNLLFYGMERLGNKHFPMEREKATWLRRWILLLNEPLFILLFTLNQTAAQLWLAAAVMVAVVHGLSYIRLREIPVLDSLSWGFATSAPLIFGFLLGGWQSDFLPAALAYISWAVATHILSSIQTMDQDRASDIYTIATWLGQKTAVMLSTFLYGAAALTAAIFYGWWGVLVAAPLLLYVLNALRFVGVKNPELFSMGWRTYLMLNYPVALSLAMLVFFSQQ